MKIAAWIIAAALALPAGGALAASNTDVILGGALGGAAGAVVGNAVGGREGAIIGGALGAGTGVALTTKKNSYSGHGHYHGKKRKKHRKHWND
ncbi:hypothetical protein [Craterilacuibacter sp.]|uniref:hypothetical protein n=1 Tax=Craterilacuibacter sp. TaxID=2870909 RepID=UPI003F417889